MKLIHMLLAIVAFGFVLSCTENQRAKGWGGTADISLPHNRKLINVTWKKDDLWYLTRPMNASDSAETYEFSEKSSWGIMQGNYIIKETKEESILPKNVIDSTNFRGRDLFLK